MGSPGFTWVNLGSLGLVWVEMGDLVTGIQREIFPISRDPLDLITQPMGLVIILISSFKKYFCLFRKVSSRFLKGFNHLYLKNWRFEVGWGGEGGMVGNIGLPASHQSTGICISQTLFYYNFSLRLGVK